MPFTKLGTLIAGVVFFLGCIQLALLAGVTLGAVTEPRPGFSLAI